MPWSPDNPVVDEFEDLPVQPLPRSWTFIPAEPFPAFCKAEKADSATLPTAQPSELDVPSIPSLLPEPAQDIDDPALVGTPYIAPCLDVDTPIDAKASAAMGKARHGCSSQLPRAATGGHYRLACLKARDRMATARRCT